MKHNDNINFCQYVKTPTFHHILLQLHYQLQYQGSLQPFLLNNDPWAKNENRKGINCPVLSHHVH